MDAIVSLKNGIADIKEKLKQIDGLDSMFEKCFLNTIETTVKNIDGNFFVITGDIPAMWLRDSSCQVIHYVRFADRTDIKNIILALLKTQFDFINYDPYANAFNMEKGMSWDANDYPPKKERVWEQKYEIDSLCYPVMLSREYYKKTGDLSFLTPQSHKALRRIVDLFKVEQRHENSPYLFVRQNCPETDTLKNNGLGTKVSYTGMTWSGFRPSDDACEYHYLVPSNLFAARILKDIAFYAEKLNDEALKSDSLSLRDDILSGVEKFAYIEDEKFGKVLAYELDGLGNSLFMDDANVPSLISLPYLDAIDINDETYQNTRQMVLSNKNPYYYEGKKAKGVGSPHTHKNYIWHIALCMQGLTSSCDKERAELLDMLISTTANTGFMHEGFDKDNPNRFTRGWFAWANSLFAEFILSMEEKNVLDKVLALLKNRKVEG